MDGTRHAVVPVELERFILDLSIESLLFPQCCDGSDRFAHDPNFQHWFKTALNYRMVCKRWASLVQIITSQFAIILPDGRTIPRDASVAIAKQIWLYNRTIRYNPMIHNIPSGSSLSDPVPSHLISKTCHALTTQFDPNRFSRLIALRLDVLEIPLYQINPRLALIFRLPEDVNQHLVFPSLERLELYIITPDVSFFSRLCMPRLTKLMITIEPMQMDGYWFIQDDGRPLLDFVLRHPQVIPTTTFSPTGAYPFAFQGYFAPSQPLTTYRLDLPRFCLFREGLLARLRHNSDVTWSGTIYIITESMLDPDPYDIRYIATWTVTMHICVRLELTWEALLDCYQKSPSPVFLPNWRMLLRNTVVDSRNSPASSAPARRIEEYLESIPRGFR